MKSSQRRRTEGVSTDISMVFLHSISSPAVGSWQEPVLRGLIGALSLPSFAFRWVLLLRFSFFNSFFGGKNRRVLVCFPSDQDQPAGAVLLTPRRPPKHFRFIGSWKLCFPPPLLGRPGGEADFVPICFRFPQGTSGSLSFLFTSPLLTASCHRRLLHCSVATSGPAASRTSASSSRFTSTEALVSHISFVSLPSAHRPDGVWIPSSRFVLRLRVDRLSTAM